ncbi:hypothetical protein QTP88_027069 [Uroleucon formosanum]
MFFLNMIYKAIPTTEHLLAFDTSYDELVDLCKTVYPEANRDFVVKKIQSFRGSFRKELKKVEDSKRSGRSADEVHIPTLWYYHLLEFTVDQELPTGSINELLDKDFHLFTYDEKCKLKNKKPTPYLAIEYKDGKFTRKFQTSWYNKFTWLSGCDKGNKLFCFICVFFRGEKEWSFDGISTIKNIIRKAEKHSISKTHLKNQEQFYFLGKIRIEHAISEGRRLEAQKHNEQVGINRRILARMVHVVCYLGKQELAFRGHRENTESLNKGNYLELLDLLAQEEQFLKEHFISSFIFKGTSNTIQNYLIQCVTKVLNSKILKEIKSASFVSVQANETTDVSCRSQMSLIFRYVIDQNIIERFIGIFDVSKDKTASGLAGVINAEIIKWEIGNKIVSQAYDGASSVKLFICNLTMFHTFFSRSSKRSSLLREQGFKLPNQSDTRWNYHSRAASTIKIHFQELKNSVKHVPEESNWDPISIATASGLLDKLNDTNGCVNEVQKLRNNLLRLRNEEIVDNCCEEVNKLNDTLIYDCKLKATLRKISYEVLDSLTVQIDIRFKDFSNFEFVELTNEKMFKCYSNIFLKPNF